MMRFELVAEEVWEAARVLLPARSITMTVTGIGLAHMCASLGV